MELKRSFRNFTRGVSAYFREIDFPLFAAAVALCFLSVLNIYGIGGTQGPFFTRQLILVTVGIAVMIALSFFNYRYLKNYSFPVLFLYLLGVALLVGTLVSPSIRGTRAWIVLGNFTFEPSELAKLMLIIFMAKYFSQRHIHINMFRHVLISGLYFVIPLGLILIQPDLGSAVILSVVWGGMLLAAGINARHLFLLAIVGILLAYAAWVYGLEDYQRERLVAFVNPYTDPTGIGYNIIQSQIAIGAGSWFGQGLGEGSQATLGFLPEASTDFVFAALAEQFGFVGITVTFGLLALLLFRILRIGERVQNNFGKLFAVGMSIFIGAHVFISAAVNIGLLPVTGIPFSFLSYGGSHLISLMIGLGTLQSIKRYG